jgi:hypothetical protein
MTNLSNKIHQHSALLAAVAHKYGGYMGPVVLEEKDRLLIPHKLNPDMMGLNEEIAITGLRFVYDGFYRDHWHYVLKDLEDNADPSVLRSVCWGNQPTPVQHPVS